MTLPEYRRALARRIRQHRRNVKRWDRFERNAWLHGRQYEALEAQGNVLYLARVLEGLCWAARHCPDVDGRPEAPLQTVTVSMTDPFGEWMPNREVFDSRGNRRRRRGV